MVTTEHQTPSAAGPLRAGPAGLHWANGHQAAAILNASDGINFSKREANVCACVCVCVLPCIGFPKLGVNSTMCVCIFEHPIAAQPV